MVSKLIVESNRKTKSAKEELEEMGEETENVITTQSKLRDVIKEATAVASNEYKGFDILDDNGNYKSTYEIMLGIAEVYDEILETDKKFGRNNANLLLENVAGKNRANIAASIFQNPELLKKAYASSQSADNSAMRENEKYVQSISGHLAQLKNAWQEMWANAANREVINFFIDAAKAVVNFVNAIGLIPSTLVLSLPFLEMISKAKSGKGLVTSFLEWANGLNEVEKMVKELGEAEVTSDVASTASSAMKTAANQAETASALEQAEAYEYVNYTEALESTADLEGTITSTAKSAANMEEKLSEIGKEGDKATSKLGLLGGAFKGLASAIGAPTLAFAGFIAICFAAKKAYDAYNEARFNEAKQATDSIKQQQDSMLGRIESYKELKAQLDSGDLSEQETIETKQKILDIQKEIVNQYGSAAKGVDLVNGKLEQQVGILNSITEKDADEQYGRNYKGFQVANKEYNKARQYTISLPNSFNEELNEQIQNTLSESGLNFISSNSDYFDPSKAGVFKNAADSIDTLQKARDSLEELKNEYRDSKDIETIDKQISELDAQIGKAYEVIDKYEETVFKGMELELARNHRSGYDIFQNYQTSISDLESAYASGNNKKIEETRKAFDEANMAKLRFLTLDNNNQFAPLFDNIDTSFVKAKNQYYDIISLLKDIPEPVEEKSLLKKEENKNKIYKKDSKALDKLTKSELKAYKAAEKLYKLNPDRIDIEGTLLDDTYASGKFTNALNELMNELGLTTDNADNLIDALVDAGIVQGNAADIANYSADSYKTFSTSVEEAINALSILNTAMSESASGKGITDQTLEELKKSFGQDVYYALEKTANGYHINTRQAYLLRQEQEALINGDYSSALMEQYKALDKLHEGYNNALEKGEDVTGFIQQRKAIEENITKLQDEMMAFNNSNSAYQTWLANQSGSGDREMYESIYSGFDAIKDEFEHGWAGIKTRSWMDLILDDEGEADFDVWDASASELKKRYEKLSKDIEGTGGYSIKDFFIDDGNGKITSKGVANFFKAIENKQKEIGKEFVHLNEEGRKVFDFEENGDYQIADLLGIDVEAVQAILRAAVEAGAEVNLDQPIYSIERLGEKAEEAKASLEEALGGELNINLNPESLEEANLDMAKLAQYRDDLKNDISIDPKVKTERLQQLADIMTLLAAKGREITEKNLIDFKFDNSALYKADKKLNTVYQGLEKYTNRFGKRTEGLDRIFSVDPSTLNNLDDLKYFYGTVKEAKLNPEVDSSQIKLLDELLKAIEEKITAINKQPIGGKNLTFSEYQKGLETVKQINDYIQKANETDVNFEFNWAEDADFMQLVQWIDGLDEEQKLQLKLDPDLNTQQIIDMAKKGKTITFNVESNKSPSELVPTAPTNTQELKQDVQQIIHTKIEASDSASSVFDEVSKKAEGFERPYIGELLIEDNASEDTKEAQKTVDKFGKTVRNAKIGVLGSGDSINKANATRDALYEIPASVSSSVNIDVFGAHKIRSALDELSQLRNAAKNNIHLNITKANGTANAFGTAFSRGSMVSGDAFAGGKWGTSKAQTALVGELGTEIMVTPNGQWQTIGDTGAEFVRIPKGSIIFNHKQSEELLQNGHVTSNQGRGHLVGFANGTAYANGVAFSNGDITDLLSSGGNGNSGSGSNGGGNGNHGNNNNKGNNNKSSEKTKDIKNTLDEVEILIARIERQISRLDNTIGNTYTKWATRNQAITRDLTKVSEEIKDQKEAYNTYMDKANSIGLPKEWVTIIQNGQQAIEDVVEKAKENGDASDTLWDKITKYREYYEKALAALDKAQELEQKEGELYKTRFDHEQTYYEEMIDNLQHTVDIMGAYNDQLEESGKLNSRNLIIKQMSVERAKLQKLEDEYTILVKRQDEAVKSGKIKKYSEAWYEMQQAINDVRDAIVEANTNLISFDNAFREVNWNRWDKIHDAISGVTNELEFLYDLIDEDKMFDDTGTITNEGLAAFGLLTQEYDTYFREVERYRDEIKTTKQELAKDEYNQNLVDKLKEQIEAQQDAINGAKKTKEAMLDVAENGIKKQIDYIKKLIDDYEELMDAQKDQSDYAKKVADQQKEINKLEKQYRAIQNDTSEEGAAKRQQLREQLKEKRQDLADTQEDRRISETKDMLAKFQETFEDFLENKLKDVEGIIKEGINGINSNGKAITDTINGLASSYGYTPSQTLQNALAHFNTDFASYFNSAFDNDNVRSIVHGVDTIVNYYTKAQKESNKIAMADKVKETGTHIQAYVDEKGKTHVGYFDNNGNHMTKYTGQAKSGDKIYRFENGQKVTKGNRWLTEGGKKYYLNKNGTYATGITSINGKKYYFDSNGQMKTAWQTINGKKYHFNKQGVMHTGLVTIGKNKYYFDKNGVLQMGKWQEINGKRYYLSATDGHVLTGKKEINGEKWTFYNDGVLKQKGWKKGTSSVPSNGYAWTNEGFKAEAIIRKSDGAILTPLNRGDSVIPSNAMKNMYQALTNPEKYLKQYTTPDVRVVQANNGKGGSTPATINMQFIANGVQDANKFVNDLMNNKKLEKWIQEVTLGQANGNNSFRKYSYAIR